MISKRSISLGLTGPSPGPNASEPIGTRDMFSTPAPITTSWAPDSTPWAAKFTACWPEPQNRFTVVPGTSIGKPAISAAARAIFMPCSPVCVTQPATTSSTCAGSTPARLTTSRKASASKSSGRTGLSLPLRRPIAVRTASTMTASVMDTLLWEGDTLHQSKLRHRLECSARCTASYSFVARQRPPLGLGNQEAQKENAQTQAQENAQGDPVAAPDEVASF